MKRNVNRVEDNEHIKLNLSVPAQPGYLYTEMMNNYKGGTGRYVENKEKNKNKQEIKT